MRSCSTASRTSTVSRLVDEHLDQAAALLVRACWAERGADAGFADFEARLHSMANAAIRRQLEARLCEIEARHDDELLIDGDLYRRHEPGVVQYYSLVGTLNVKRWTYRRVGVRNGPTVVPLELAAGLIHRTTPSLAYSVALAFGTGPMRHYEKQMTAAHRQVPPRATLERLAVKIGASARTDVVEIEEVVRATETLPSGAHAIAVSLDRTSVAMAEERSAETAPNSHRRSRTTPYQRRPPQPIDVNWRMLYVGTMSIVDGNGETLSTRKYHATPEEGTDAITARMMADVVHCRSHVSLPVVVVQDGAPEMWNVMRATLRVHGIEKWTEVLDRFHVDERLAAALELIEPDESVRRKRLRKWQHQLDHSERAAERIADWLHRRWRDAARSGSYKASALSSHAGYINGYSRLMNYAACRRAGFPIGSGPVEGACKSLVACRAKRSGQRWKQNGLTAALTLRSIEQSQRLPAFWAAFTPRFSAAIVAA